MKIGIFWLVIYNALEGVVKKYNADEEGNWIALQIERFKLKDMKALHSFCKIYAFFIW